ncbi:hypothetical protein SOV_33470 [Sporomusa ovata DSM 2662]|uniref:Uncharacterized protein n=1 Tax=Sporomusa ovata TaxID=2378 RepID=A0A0U1L2V2_9FIRM|nr:hypothetical protein [Sporomusa ovata]EQB25282.1 hypothetical protein SOV_5c04500 [Sporomusa ovata DSM 2662]CQR73845.1 hypothetical protein SpAn4DRAFT_0307 [Sporomusa ovata]
MGKVHIEVVAKHDKEGRIRPLSLIWENERKFPIDRVLDIRQAASLKAGLQGMRYTCRIAGKEVYLFCDEGKWFLEK